MLYLPLLRRFVEFGTLTVIDPGGRAHRIKGADGPSAVIRLHDSSVGWVFVLNPALAVGEAYMAGRLTIEEGTLFDFLTIALVNQRRARLRSGSRVLEFLRKAAGRFWTYNPVGRAHRRVSHHYDLAPGLFDLFLDSDRQYSCAYFALEGD
ncbi:MAG: class I SAM-dependent methyltransferase, partial [Alphaproteobacteria bacterium]|nr:class I SAM-dependent methyltransferase [Alphaproteobacteria bacterium]